MTERLLLFAISSPWPALALSLVWLAIAIYLTGITHKWWTWRLKGTKPLNTGLQHMPHNERMQYLIKRLEGIR